MTKDEIKKTLASGIVKFNYTKKDGTVRTATGTLQSSVIAEHDATPTGLGSERSGVINYFDTEKEAWRSFNEGKFIEFLNQE